MKISFRGSMIITFFVTMLLIQIHLLPVKANLEYKVNIGDKISYTVVKLDHEEIAGQILPQGSVLNRTIWDTSGNRCQYQEQQGTSYSLTVTNVTTSGVYAEIRIDNQLVSQSSIDIVNFNRFTSFVIPTTTNHTYYEQLSLESDHYELSGNFLNVTGYVLTAGSPIMTVGAPFENIFDIKTGWLESCSYWAPDFDLTEPDGIEYVWYEYELKKLEANLGRTFFPFLNIWQFTFLSLFIVGIGIVFVGLYKKFLRS